jgi:hypothetical protein
MCRVIGRATSQLVNTRVRKASGDWVACTTAPICRPLGSSTAYWFRSSINFSFCLTTSTCWASSDPAGGAIPD